MSPVGEAAPKRSSGRVPRYQRDADNFIGRFLLLEDNREQQRVLTRHLEEHRPVDLAESISEARVRLGSGVPYIGYVFDVTLPDGDGMEFLREVRDLSDPGTPAIIVTALPVDRELAMKASAVGVLLSKVGAECSPQQFLRSLGRFVDAALDHEWDVLGPRAALFDLSDGELTEAQMDVAVLGVAGHGRAEIAEMLGITVHTARSHIRDVLLKTGLKGRGLSALARAVNRRRSGR